MIYSIRTKILFLGLIFVALISIAFFIYSMITTVNYKRLRLEGIEHTVAFETEKVNKTIAEIEHGAVFYAISGTLCYNTKSKELGENLIIEYINSFPFIAGGGFWFEPYAFKSDLMRVGFYAVRGKDARKITIDDSLFLDEYDYHNKGWYREIIENITSSNQVFWTRPYVDDASPSSLMTTAGAGIFDDSGKLMGVATADWEIEDVIRELIAIKPTENSFVILCVPERDYVISSTRTNEIIGLPMSRIPYDITADSFNFNGIDYVRFGKYMDNGWLLSIQIPEYEIIAEVEKQNKRFSILIAIVSVLMFLIAYILISRLINAPIKQLTHDLSHIVLGNLDTQLKINSKDELGLLAQVFNKMTGDLKISIEEQTKERTEKQRISDELSVAATIQTSMLPNIFPPFPGRKEFDLFALMVPAKEVCGDFYDFFFLDKDNLAVLIADVSGKGIPAALFMVIAKTLIKNCSSCRTPRAVFDTVNKKLCEGNETGMFVTAFIGFYNIPSGKLVYVNAGHNPPLVKKKGSSFKYLSTNPCIVLGFMETTIYTEDEMVLEPGDILYLYTDGITEAVNNSREFFGEQRLLNCVNKNRDSGVYEMLSAIKQEVDIFAEGAEQADDITMLGLLINSEQSAESSEELKVFANADNLESVINFIDTKLINYYSSEIKNEICIAAEEIFMNIVNYAYGHESGEVKISVSVYSGKTVIKFEDTGKPYNPLEQPDPDLNKSIKERQIGGLGIFMVKKIMDSIEYSRDDGRNILIIGKKITERK